MCACTGMYVCICVLSEVHVAIITLFECVCFLFSVIFLFITLYIFLHFTAMYSCTFEKGW